MAYTATNAENAVIVISFFFLKPSILDAESLVNYKLVPHTKREKRFLLGPVSDIQWLVDIILNGKLFTKVCFRDVQVSLIMT